MGALVLTPQQAKPARKSTRYGVGDGSPGQHAPHPKPVGGGPRPHAPRAGGQALESAQPRTPQSQARGAPPRGPSCRPNRTQSQLARARAERWVRCPQAHTPRTHIQWVAGLGRTPQGSAVGRGRASNSRRPMIRQETRPPRAPSGCPHSAQSRLARARAVELVTGLYAHIPPTHSQGLTGPGRTPQGRAVGRERAHNPDAPHPGKRRPPLGALMLPPQRAKPAGKSARCGVGDGSPSHTPRTDSQWVAGPGCTPQGRAVGHGRAPNHGRPTPTQEVPSPRAPLCCPHNAQSQLARVRAEGW